MSIMMIVIHEVSDFSSRRKYFHIEIMPHLTVPSSYIYPHHIPRERNLDRIRDAPCRNLQKTVDRTTLG